MKKIKKYLYAITILMLFILMSVSIVAASTQGNVYLSLDSSNIDELPKNFRKTTDLSVLKNSSLNLEGLSDLNISGSKQFAEKPLSLLIKDINHPKITIVDLRQESHGFINGNAVSWFSPGDKANRGLSLDEVLVKEKKQLSSIELNKPLQLNKGKHTLIPTIVENEETLAKKNNLDYFRITVTDGERPTDDMVDRFMSFINKLPEDQWLHFHCKAGIGRTTTFMAMFDMTRNSKKVSFDDIINRQQDLAQLEKSLLDKNDKRTEFLNNFYKYTKENTDNFKSTWSDYIKANNIEPYTNKSVLPKT